MSGMMIPAYRSQDRIALFIRSVWQYDAAMQVTIPWICLLLAFVCFAAASVGAQPPRLNLTSLGLAFLSVSFLIARTA